MQHSKRPHCSLVTDQLSPCSRLCPLLAAHLSPLSAPRRASGYQNRVHRNHALLIACPHGSIPHGFLSDRLSTWGGIAARRRLSHLFAFPLSSLSAQRRHLSPARAQRVIGTIQPKCEAYYDTAFSPPKSTLLQDEGPPAPFVSEISLSRDFEITQPLSRATSHSRPASEVRWPPPGR